MDREVKNAHYGRLALASYDYNLVSWQNTTKKYRVSYVCCSAFFFIQNVRKRLQFRKKLWFWWFRVQFIPGYVNIGDIEVEDDGNLGDNDGATGPHYRGV